MVLEAGDRPAGSWPHYYDSLRLFSPAAYSSMPGMPFPGDPDRYPARDEVADYLERYAATIPVEIQTSTRVVTVRQEDREFVVMTADGRQFRAAGIVAASGSFSNPHRPVFPGQGSFTGELLHVAEYRNPTPLRRHAGDRRRRGRFGGPGRQRARAGRRRHARRAAPASVHPTADRRSGRALLAA